MTKRYVQARELGDAEASKTIRDQLVHRLGEDGLLDERSIQHLVQCLQPGGEQRVLTGESCEQAVTRLMRHYGWDERTAERTIALSEGWSDLAPEDDVGNPLPYFRLRDAIEAAESSPAEATDPL